ncbi:CLUMA_CG004362, isoform A [Clunio marinus]|uniref:CLUMA_CG004362, isoform A n=1 Tax=Clunio marinus TaxID=568069 RepID=A0A1J1HRL1_9DIPT|nr:CLUMA_CG004362, isoform A [Clunio marinus]
MKTQPTTTVHDGLIPITYHIWLMASFERQLITKHSKACCQLMGNRTGKEEKRNKEEKGELRGCLWQAVFNFPFAKHGINFVLNFHVFEVTFISSVFTCLDWLSSKLKDYTSGQYTLTLICEHFMAIQSKKQEIHLPK